MMDIVPEYMVGRSFLSNPTDNGTIDNGEKHRAFIVKLIEGNDNKMAKDPASIKFYVLLTMTNTKKILHIMT